MILTFYFINLSITQILSMSFELTNFTKRYEEAVSSIKIIKQSNQRVLEKTSHDFRQ